MPEPLSKEERAEISELNHEIYRLSELLEESERERLRLLTADPADPFDNPTEYREYGICYARIREETGAPGFKPALDPPYHERQKIKKYYMLAGLLLLLHFLFTDLTVQALMNVIIKALISMNPDVPAAAAVSYLRGSSIVAALNMIVYIVGNVGAALIGLHFLPKKLPDLLKTRDYSVKDFIQYSLIALMMFFASVYLSNIIEHLFSKLGYTTDTMNTSGIAVTRLGTLIMIVYGCIIAPITEELFFRGMLLRAFSAVNQRFGIFATALFFGLSHKNLPQFILAFTIGIFLAHITMRHDSIIPAVIVHIFINSTSELLSHIDMSGANGLIMTFIIDIFIVIGILAFIAFTGQNKLPLSTPAQSRRGLPLAASSIFCILAFVGEFAYMILLILSK